MTGSRVNVLSAGTLVVLAALQSTAHAQLFGNQNIGTPPGTQLRSPFGNGGEASAGSSFGVAAGQAFTPSSGVLDGNERFVRGNRSRQDFVGTGRNDLTGFVGLGQAIGVGRVPAATDSFRLEATNAARVNKPLPMQPAKGMYYPRLVLDSESMTLGANSPVALSEIQRRVKNAGGESVQVFVAGGTAILSGSVNSKQTAELVINILCFEPGIDTVENRLSVP